MMKIAICDDEQYFRERVKVYVGTYLEKKEIMYEIDTFRSGEDILELGIEMLTYSIVFLDIKMDGINGMDIARKIREYSSDIFIVFITAYIDYSLEGYKVRATRYLLKNDTNLEDYIYECMDTILERMKYVVFRKKFLFNECEKNIPLEKIIYIESKLHKLEFHIMEEEIMIYTMYGTLNALEKDLSSFDFIRIHQSFLVNLQHIKKVGGYRVTLSNKQVLTIPKVRYRDVKNAFISYMGQL